jgi:Fe-S-cluster containining protein
MNRAERRRQERDARKKGATGPSGALSQQVDVAAIKRRLQQQTSPEKVHQFIASLIAQGLPREAGEELAVYAAEYHDATAILQAGKEAEQVTAVVSNAHSWADSMINQSPEMNRRACQSGCAFCCYVPTVLVTAAEAVYLADWLRAHCSVEELDALRTRLVDRQQRQQSFTTSTTGNPPIPCALLQNNQCMAYAARPLKCRGWNSLRRDVCEQAYGHSQSLVQIPADAYAFMMGNAVFSGLRDSATHAGLDGRTYDLTEALLQVLDMPDVVQRWRDGERIYATSQKPR